jgi:enterochelin esterase-like enzyme
MPASWLRMGLDQTMDRLIEAGEIAPYIVVMPAIPRIKINGAAYQDWNGENEWLAGELMVGIDATYRTRQARLYRGIGGISQGGAIAGIFGWKHPELFGAIGLYGAVQPVGGYSPGWTRRSAELSALLDSVPTDLAPHVYIDVGREDGLWINNLSLTLHLRDRLMPYIFHIEEGGHSPVYWGGHLEEYLRWFDGVFGMPASRLQRATPPKTVATLAHTACGKTTGTRTSIQINHPMASESNWPATEIHLPPCYAEYDDVAYPVLYLLHSEGESPMQWFSMGADETMDTLIAEGAIPPFILVAPPQGELLDDFAPWLVDTVLPTVEAQFHIVDHRAWRGVAGLSLGGTRAIEIGHAYPELFGSIGGYSAASPSAMDLLENAISETLPHLQPQILLDIGNRDPLKSDQESLHQLYTAYNWPHTSTISDGAHLAAYWAERLEYYLVWHGNAFGSVIAQD